VYTRNKEKDGVDAADGASQAAVSCTEGAEEREGGKVRVPRGGEEEESVVDRSYDRRAARE